MIIIDETLLSDDVLESYFQCELSKCKGACCVSGDRGAPLESKEIEIIENNLAHILPYLSPESKSYIAENNFWETDPSDQEQVTTCLPNGACVFVIQDKGVSYCGIEKAYYEQKSDFLKPISCHLYPIRIKQYGEYQVLNYHKWDICNAACLSGKENKIDLIQFSKNALIRKIGSEWFEKLQSKNKN